MKIQTKEIYRCEFCNKLYQRKNACLNHEKYCYKNPQNYRPCFGCSHLVLKEETIYELMGTNYGTGEPKYSEINVKAFYCLAKKHFLYTPQNEMKGNKFDFGDDDDYKNEPMPLVCDQEKPWKTLGGELT